MKKLKFKDREWNYFLNEGDLVSFAKDIPKNHKVINGDNFLEEINLKEYENKIGIVKKCRESLHAFGRGSSYVCDVDFEGKIISNFTQFFLKQKLINEKTN